MHFTDSVSSSGDSSNTFERRHHARQAPHSLSYIHLDETNGGILINLSEGGLAVQAAMSVMEDALPRVRLQAPQSHGWLEASARVIWTSDSRRMVGIQFVEFPEDFRQQLREWLSEEAAVNSHQAGAGEPPSEADHDATSEKISSKRERAMSLPRVQPRSKDFDLATITPAEVMSVSRSAHAIQEPAAQAVPRIAAPAVETSEPESKKADSRGRYVPVLVMLAVISLVAGWEAGRGNLSSTFAALVKPSAAASAPGSVDSMRASAASVAAAQFEVVDANNQSWLVPFSGPTTAPQGAALPALPPQAPAPVSRTAPVDNGKRGFQSLTFVAPKSAGHQSGLQSGSQAPVLPTQASGLGNAFPNAFGDTSPRSSLTPPSTTTTASDLVPASVIRRVSPTYPKGALDQRIYGVVQIHARINEDGSVSDVKATSGSPLLTSAAVDAVRKWQYKAETLDGRPVASDINVTVTFALPQ
jgi:TonB family protein